MNGADFFRSCLTVASCRLKTFVLFNFLFFSCVFGALFLLQFLLLPPVYSGWSPWLLEAFLGNWGLMFLGVFAFNLAVSAFVMVTLPGFVFFPLSVGFLLYRAFLWAMLLYAVPSWLFLATLPTLVLEGEAYVFAAVAGTITGMSWFKPAWLFKTEAGEEELSRAEGFRKGLSECLRLYIIVALLLFVAAILETVTILSI